MFYSFAKAVVNIFYTLFFRVRVTGLETFPASGGAVVCANHSSYHDPVVLAAKAPRVIRYMAKKELFDHKLLSPIIKGLYAFPVDRDGHDLSALKSAIKTLKSGDIIGIFSQGRRVRGGDEQAAKSGVALMAIKAGVPVVPVSIKSSFKLFSVIELGFGEPIDLSSFAEARLSSQALKAATDLIMNGINKRLEDGA